MVTHLYRYRPARAVLGKFQELERGEIYFSTAEELNDPMEGFKDVYWQGDEIVWRNLLKHYALCVLQTAACCFVAGPEFDAKLLNNIVFWVPQELPVAPIRGIYERVLADFLGEPAAQAFIRILSARSTPVRRYELITYLRALHGFALQAVLKEYRHHGLFPPTVNIGAPPPREKLRADAISMMENAVQFAASLSPSEAAPEMLFSATEATMAQAALIGEYVLPEREKRLPLVHLTYRFPSAYVSALDKLMHRDWYAACFSKNAENHSMWSTYGDGHRGVCLKFRVGLETAPSLTLERVTSLGGSKNGEFSYGSSFVPHSIKPVVYSRDYPSIDFFRSLGTVRIPHLNGFWYLGEDGKFSACRNAMHADENAWRAAYWDTFERSALCKTPEWAHEEEYRILFHSGFDVREPEMRKLKYRFEDLSGIVFGLRTDVEDKLQMMRIVVDKCAATGRTGFEFWEVRYQYTDSRFFLARLELLKLDAAGRQPLATSSTTQS